MGGPLLVVLLGALVGRCDGWKVQATEVLVAIHALETSILGGLAPCLRIRTAPAFFVFVKLRLGVVGLENKRGSRNSSGVRIRRYVILLHGEDGPGLKEHARFLSLIKDGSTADSGAGLNAVYRVVAGEVGVEHGGRSKPSQSARRGMRWCRSIVVDGEVLGVRLSCVAVGMMGRVRIEESTTDGGEEVRVGEYE
jgi:hypothetical protein